MYKRIYIIGIAAYIIMFVLSVVFYKERTIFPDASFYLFHIINDGAFCLQQNRFGDAFGQIAPLLASRAGLSMDAVILCYSAWLVCCYFFAYVICGSVLKQYGYAIIILLIQVLFTADTFYLRESQVIQGMTLLVLTLAIMNGNAVNGTKPAKWALLTCLLIILAFFHPLMAIVIAYALSFLILGNDSSLSKKSLYIIGSLFFIIVIIKMVFFRVPYEQHSMSGLKNFIRLYPHYLNTYSNKRFLQNCTSKYYWIPVLSALIVIHYAREKAWKKMCLFIAAMTGYLLLVNICYPDATTPQFYIENLYLPLCLFLSLPLIFDVAPSPERRKIAFPLLILIIITGCIRLYTTHKAYTVRLAYERKLLAAYGDKKIVLSAKRVSTDTLIMLWCTPYEFLLLSVSEHKQPASIIIDEAPEKLAWMAAEKNALVVNWDIYPYGQLNQKYFHFTDTTSGYIIDAPTQ